MAKLLPLTADELDALPEIALSEFDTITDPETGMIMMERKPIQFFLRRDDDVLFYTDRHGQNWDVCLTAQYGLCKRRI